LQALSIRAFRRFRERTMADNPPGPNAPATNVPVLPDAVTQALAALAAALTNINTTNPTLATNNAATNAILTALTNQIAAQQVAPAVATAAVAATTPTTRLDPIFQNAALDLSSPTGAAAYVSACAKLEQTWDGSVDKFPHFVLALTHRARESNWAAIAPHGILLIQDITDPTKTYNLLEDYNEINEADIANANANRTDNRALQNATTLRYQGATVFVDHFLDFTYLHLMTKMDGKSTVEAKLAFERVASSHGVNVLHYHANNGLFDSKVFKESVAKGIQTLSFCGVNAHHQNGRAEARIKDITTNARTALLHAAHRWPKAIHASLWPSALKNYTNIRNALPTNFFPAEKQARSTLSARYEHSPLSKILQDQT
jgi:hypothetical protein